MTTREKVLIVGFSALLLVGVFLAYQWHQNSILLAQASAESQARREAMERITDAMKVRDEQYQRDRAEMMDRFTRLQTMTPKQIVEKVPIYIPQATAPVTISDGTQVAPAGSAIVPKEDIKPIAETILAGEKCKLDLGKCVGDRDDWQAKYTLAAADAKTWEKAAKGGSKFKRTMSTIGKVGIGVAVGYAVARR